jgi:predicted permease
MRKLRALWIRLCGLLSVEQADSDFDAEIESHVGLATDDGIRSGLSPEEARRQALIRLGRVEQTRQAWRERRTLPWLETLLKDLRFGLRMLAKNPGFTAVAVLTLALGIGVTSAVFTVAEAALLRSWPAKTPERLVKIVAATPEGEDPMFSYPDYVDLSGQTRSLTGVVAYSRHEKILRVGTESHLVLDDVVSPNYFSVLGIDAQRGRLLSAGSQTASEPGVVISDTLWHRYFNADAALVGKQIQLTGRHYTVLGIAPPRFRGLQRGVPTDLWLPTHAESAAYQDEELTDRKTRDFELLGRLQPGVTPAEAKVELDTVGRRLAQAYPAIDKARNVALVSERERLREVLVPMFLLMTAVGMVLLICCANVAGLVMARSDARSKEIAMRMALGAGRLRLVRQLLTESLLLASMGAALGLLLAVGLLRLQPALMPPSEIELGFDLHLDAFVVVFTLAITVFAVLVFGLTPALRASKLSYVSVLKDERAGTGGGVRRWTLRNALVLSEIALSVILLTAAGLVTRSLLFSRAIPLGFDREKHLIFFDLTPGLAGYNPQRSVALFEQLQDRTAALPGVRHASVARRVLLSDSGGGLARRVSIPGVVLPQGQISIPIKFNAVAGNYFQTMGTRLREGRTFNSADNPSTRSVVVVSQTMAERFWPGQEVLGRQIQIEGKACQIVGVVDDAKINGVHEAPEPYMYLPLAQMPSEEGALIIESEGSTDALTASIRREIRSADPNIPVAVRTVDYLMQQAFWTDRMAAGFVGALGLVGIFLGAVGLYGVIAFTVNRRSQEIGIRMALGAERKDIVRMVVGQGLKLAVVGTVAGLVGALFAMRLMSTMLYGVKPTDPIAYAGSAILVIVVALAASWIPARHAASIDPMRALRTE